MHKRTLTDLDRVVAIGGGHGLGRVLSALSFLGNKLTGIVATTDNGGSTGRIRRAEGGIAWGDMRNCLNQLITIPSPASAMFEYRFKGEGELAGHNLGNLMLKALDDLSVRPLEAINIIRDLLHVEALLIPMSEHPIDLVATDAQGNTIYGEVSVDAMDTPPVALAVVPTSPATPEALDALSRADLILIGPGSFYTSLMPILLLEDICQAVKKAKAPLIYLDNLGRELSPARQLSLEDRIQIMERQLGPARISALLTGEQTTASPAPHRCVLRYPLEDPQLRYRHDRQRLREALDQLLHRLSPLSRLRNE